MMAQRFFFNGHQNLRFIFCFQEENHWKKKSFFDEIILKKKEKCNSDLNSWVMMNMRIVCIMHKRISQNNRMLDKEKDDRAMMTEFVVVELHLG